jgi:hypothetical protein
MSGRQSGLAERPGGPGEAVRSQGLHSTDAGRPVERAGSKTAPREGRQEVGCERSAMEQANPGSAVKAKQGRDVISGETCALWWAEASIWTDRMVSALGNGGKACPRAGEARPEGRQMVQPDRQGHSPGHSGSCVATRCAEQGGGRGGWPER